MTSREAYIAAHDRGDVDAMRRMLHAAIESGSPLIKAADRGQLKQCRTLLRADPAAARRVEPVSGVSALHASCGRNHVNVVRLLLKHSDVNLGDATG